MKASFTSPTSPPANNAYLFEDINQVTFTATGTGQASIVFGASFVPATVNTLPVYRGMSVSKVIQNIDPVTFNAVGAPITSAAIGALVRVTIQVVIPDYTLMLIVADPFPGAIEPLDPNVYTTISSSPPPPLFYDYLIWWSPPVKTQYLPDTVTFISGPVYAGTQTFSYIALVNSNGQFVVGPAIAYDKTQPEVMGLSAGFNFTTKIITGGIVGNDATCFHLIERQLDPKSLPSNFQFNYAQPSAAHPVIHHFLVFLSLVLFMFAFAN